MATTIAKSSVKLIRDDHIEEIIPRCFICNTGEISNFSGKKDYFDMINVFKGFLLDSYQYSGELSPSKKTKILKNRQTCAPCYSSILAVWNSYLQIQSLQSSIDYTIKLCKIWDNNEVVLPEDNQETVSGIGIDDDDSMDVDSELQQSDNLENDIDAEFDVHLDDSNKENNPSRSSIVGRRTKGNAVNVYTESELEPDFSTTTNYGVDTNYDPGSMDDSDSAFYDTQFAPTPCKKKRSYLLRPRHPVNPNSEITKSFQTPRNICAVRSLTPRIIWATRKILQDREKLAVINSKLFPCDKCDAKFTFEKDLERHENTHPRTKLFVCYQCGKSYSQKPKLVQHKKACEVSEVLG